MDFIARYISLASNYIEWFGIELKGGIWKSKALRLGEEGVKQMVRLGLMKLV